jgi:hypothetical protein
MKMLSIHLRYFCSGCIGAAAMLMSPAVMAEAAADMSSPSAPEILLDLHNEERARLSLPLLVWDPKLAQDATNYAKVLADTDTFEHAPQAPGNEAQGENLWMGTRGFYGWKDMVGSWVEEREFMKSGKFPEVSTTGNWTDVGHYTQLIWTKTQYVGCGIQNNANDEFLVCRYFPAGNEYGEMIRVK